MKRSTIMVYLFALSYAVFSSEIIPPRIVIKWLTRAVQEGQTNSVTHYFAFDAEKHGKLTPLSREAQINILNDIRMEKIKFEKDEYFAERTNRFVVVMVEPISLEFVMDKVALGKSELGEEMGPPFKYTVIAVRKTAQQSCAGDSSNRGGYRTPEK